MPLSKIQDIGNQVVPNIGPNRNILINGAMTVAQRYTSKASISSGDFFVVDRFGGYINAAGTWTVQQDSDVPAGQGFGSSAKFDCTTANGSLGSGAELLFRQRIEGRNLQNLLKGTSSAKKTIVQFWVKSNKTGTYICELFDNDNSGRHIGKAYTISSADTWEHKTITFEGDTTGTLGNDSNTSLTMSWWLAAGSSISSGTLQTSWGTRTDANRAVGNVNLADNTSNEWYITGIQFEVGETFTEFEHEPFERTFLKCSRYFQKYYAGNNYTIFLNGGIDSASGSAHLQGALRTQMRATPTYYATNSYLYSQPGGTISYSGTPDNRCSPDYASMGYNVGAGDQGHSIRFESSGTSGTVEYDAEL